MDIFDPACKPSNLSCRKSLKTRGPGINFVTIIRSPAITAGSIDLEGIEMIGAIMNTLKTIASPNDKTMNIINLITDFKIDLYRFTIVIFVHSLCPLW